MKILLSKKILKYIDEYLDYRINEKLNKDLFWEGLVNRMRIDELIEQGKFDEALEIVKTGPIARKFR